MPDLISFSRGAPSLDILDVEGLKAAAQRALTNDPAGALAYGTAVGYLPLRNWLAEQHGVAPEQVLVTNGSMQADAFLFELTVAPGDAVIVELPTYDRTLLSLRKRGAEIYPIELESDGIDIAAVERLLADGVRPKLAHIIPNFQNPAGVTLSLQKRKRLVELAQRYGFLIFEDDPYAALGFSEDPPESMFSLDDSGSVVYVSSFTKTVCPGVRVGYLVGSVELTDGIRKLATETYISPGMVSQALVYEFCKAGALEQSITTVKRALSERAETLTKALKHQLPEAKFEQPQGGYFLWAELTDGTDAGKLLKASKAKGVEFVKGSDFVLAGKESALRLAYSAVGPEKIEEGVRRIAAAKQTL